MQITIRFLSFHFEISLSPPTLYFIIFFRQSYQLILFHVKTIILTSVYKTCNPLYTGQAGRLTCMSPFAWFISHVSQF